MHSVSTRYGLLEGVDAAAVWPDGTPRSVVVIRRNVLETPFGPLVPHYEADEKRHLRVEPIHFHRDGTLKSLPLQSRTVIRTPLGDYPAELLTFYSSGRLCRLFPLNGKLTGFWSWRDERRLTEAMRVETPQGERTVAFININFHESGRLKSLTLWPEETLELLTPLGPATARIGASFHDDGSLESFEPAAPMEIETPIGRMTAFDPDPEGLCGDVNSVRFAPDGSLAGLLTPVNTVTVKLPDGGRRLFEPGSKTGLCDEGEKLSAPLHVGFTPDGVLLGPKAQAFSRAECGFTVGMGLFPVIAAAFPCADE
ncbi:hypothetical protein dsx2_0500 [Desulfovibrio sp. X2]|uniref:hypothetical protein n=1 Tax=Desulfovibrio sp. X2 TaxID=941449 RepID=UPI000358E9B0|nr:hypothetical protein [Desulfovibrio sp. X2]EPR38691.1 hypothetical protein dsx2_0500 [Desulfovibrio sp. X2]